MVLLSDLLEICPRGAWVTEDLAVEVLGLASKEVLKTNFNQGTLPHVLVEHGGRIRAPFPYNSHAFFFFQAEGTAATAPNLSLEDWLKICRGNPKNPEVAGLIERYTTISNPEEAFNKLKDKKAIVTSLAPGIAGSADYRYGTSGGIRPSKASAASTGEIVTRADGVRVRRVKRASSAAANATSLAGFLAGAEDNKNQSTGSRSVSADGEIYIRADGKKVRRVRKSSTPSGDPSRKTLDGFLGKDENGKARLGGSASVAGDQIAVNKESSLTGEVYVRADGKKVRRVRKTTASAVPGENVEIITRPDGTRVRRIRKTKPVSAGSESAGLSGAALSSPLEKSKPTVTGSQSVAGDHLEGEIYVRPDGKKVRRVRKVAGSGAATVSGSSTTQSATSGQETEVEIYTRPDGTKVRRIKKKTSPKAIPEQKSNLNASVAPAKTLDGFLDKAVSRPKVGGSASVAGDRIAVSKDESLTGEVYVRADGKKVRRIKKSTAAPGENVEIITRPDGTKVRRIRMTRPKAEDKAGDGLSGFLDSQPSLAPKGGAATVGGDGIPLAAAPAGVNADTMDDAASKEAKAKKNLDSFLSTMESRPKKVGGSASVAGDMLAVDKNSSLTGEVYVRSDGKKVRRVRKTTVQPGDEVEIITRPDGTKVRRIKRARKPQDGDPRSGKLDGFLGASSAAPKTDGSATVTGDMLHSKDVQGEIYVRADGKKVRRIRRPIASASGVGNEQYEIYVRPDGKKVRRIRRPKVSNFDSSNGVPGQRPKASSEISAALGQTSALNTSDTKRVSAPASEGLLSSRVQTRASTLSEDDEKISAQYRKMLKMGMPDGAVMQKMAIDGVAQNIQDSVLAREIPPEVTSSQSIGRVSTLSADEEAVAQHYRKMLKMGMPDGAVIQKMAVDGVAKNVQDSVLAHEVASTAGLTIASPEDSRGTSSLSTAEEEIASHYRKMIKMGMPDGAVVQKMSVDGVAQKIQDSVLNREEPVAINSSHAAVSLSLDETTSSNKVSSLTTKEEEIASQYRKMLKMGMPDGAVSQKMTVDGVSQKIKESVLARETPVPSGQVVPVGMALVPKDQAMVSEGMVLVPKEQAARTIPAGMVAIPKEQAGGETIPEGYVLVPKNQVKGDPGKDDLVLVRKEQVVKSKEVVLISKSNETGLKRNTELNENEKAEIEGANIVSLDDLPSQVEALKQGSNGEKPRFLLQALPSDQEYQEDFIRKNLLPKEAAATSAPTPAPAPAAPSSSIAELLAQMSTMGGDFDAEKMGELLQKLETAEKRQKKLEKQLAQAGVAIAEDIDYEICLKKVAEIGKRMGEIGGSDVADPALKEEYFKLEQAMEKYNSALLLTDEYQAEQDRIEKKWEEDNAPGNLEALKKLRRHMPVEVRNMSEAQLTTECTPNGKYLPKAIAKKFKRTNVLQIIRRDPDDIVRMHPSTLENMRVTGLTLTERRGIYEHLRSVGPQWKAMKAEKMTERKWTWYNMMKGNFKENLASYQRHVDQYGPPGAHPYATRANPNEGCPLIGKQCPLKADKVIDYDNDYGFTDDAVYEVSDVKKADADDPGAKAMQEALELMKEKKANERNDALKKHYKGKLLQVSKANGSCEQMDEMMDKMEYGMMKWLEDIVGMGDDKSKLTDDVKKKEVANFTDVLSDCKLATLDICGRSGMQLSGKKGGDTKPDPRSIVECSLAEEVAEAFDVFTKFVTNRLKQTEIADTRIKSTIGMLKGLLVELRERNVKTISNLSGERLPASRKLKTQENMEKEIKDKLARAKAEEEGTGGGGAGGGGGGGGPALPGPPRGGLMDAIKAGRGRGGGRGGLLDAIKGGRGRGGGGRGGLLDAIKAGRGRGGGRGGGGRGGLLDAIKAGRGRGRGGNSGGRGGLLAAIEGRGKGGGGAGGGRGGLLAAIQARGGGG